MIRASLLGALGFAALWAAPAHAADDPTDICPAFKIAEDGKSAAYYPNGEKGRNAKDFSHIAVILTANASCVETDDDRIVATVTVTYAAESGPLYRGNATVKIKAQLAKNGAAVTEGENAREFEIPAGQHVTVTDQVMGIEVGSDDDVEAGGYTLEVSLVP